MKKLTVGALLLGLLLGLSACQRGPQEADADSDDPNVGKYWCKTIQMEELTLHESDEWMELRPDGTLSFFLTGEPDEAVWKCSGTQFTMTISGERVGMGTLSEGVLTVDLMGMTYTFVQEGSQAALAYREAPNQAAVPPTQQAETPSNTATFACYDTLYYIDYPAQLFHPDPDGLADLCSDTGTKVWLSKLDSQERVDELLTGFDQKAEEQDQQNYTSLDLTVNDTPARCILYTDSTGWHSEILVPFGKDRGSKEQPMYAAYLHFSGASQDDVWGNNAQGMVNSLRLTP